AFPGRVERPREGPRSGPRRARPAAVRAPAVDRPEPALPRAGEARALGVAARAPLMLVERTAYGASGRVLELSRDLFRGDRIRVVWESEIGGEAARPRSGPAERAPREPGGSPGRRAGRRGQA